LTQRPRFNKTRGAIFYKEKDFPKIITVGLEKGTGK
jgi:hypothetical protein